MTPPGRSPEVFAASGPLAGTAALPGDKSISHRALILAALAIGTTRIDGLNDGADVAATAEALRMLGARIVAEGGARVAVTGVGLGTLLQPQRPLDCGNSGTTARLLTGLISSHPIAAELVGDASLSRRPMARIADPLRSTGARIAADRLPLEIRGIAPALARSHRLAIPSAQVKSGLILAALNTPGITEILSPSASRDHLERMLPLFGIASEVEGLAIQIRGEQILRPCELAIPGDSSAAAPLAVAAAIVPGSIVTLPDAGINPGRTGWIDVLREMRASLIVSNERTISNEPVADLSIRHSSLIAVDVAPERITGLVDEVPILAIAAAAAAGTSRFRGLAELRHKESDRLAAVATGLAEIGVTAEVDGDDLIVRGRAEAPFGGGVTIAARDDHRVAMAFAVAGLHALKPIGIDDMSSVATSFPGFTAALRALTRA